MTKKDIFFKIEIISLLLFSTVLIIILGKEVFHCLIIKKNYNKSYQRLEKLEAKQKLLEKEINYLNSDKNLLKKARSKMNLPKEGENVIVLLEKNNQINKVTSTSQQKDKSILNKIINFFK